MGCHQWDERTSADLTPNILGIIVTLSIKYRHVIEKKIKLTVNLKKAYFSDIAQKKMVRIVRSTEVTCFEVKDHKRLV